MKEFAFDLKGLIKKIKSSRLKLKVTLMPDFFLDHFIILKFPINSFYNCIIKSAKQGGGNIPFIEQEIFKGGNAVNTAFALDGLGASAHLIVKTSKLGYMLLKYFAKHTRIDISHVKVNGKIALTSALEFFLNGRLVNVMLNDSGSVSNFGFNELNRKDKELIKNSDFVCVFNWSQNLKGTDLIKKVFGLLKNFGKGKSYLDTGDPSYRKNEVGNLVKIMKKPLIDVLSVNENEAFQYALYLDKKLLKYKFNLEEKAFLCAKILHEILKTRVDLHTLKYSASFINGESHIAPSFKVKALRVTGAGDVWNAANIYGEFLKLKPEERLLIANAAACSYISSQTIGTISLKSLKEFLRKVIKGEVKLYSLKSFWTKDV
ncbi:MAG: carbohydrate kinase family protein [Candidatus Bathyarchaeia archaeon]